MSRVQGPGSSVRKTRPTIARVGPWTLDAGRWALSVRPCRQPLHRWRASAEQRQRPQIRPAAIEIGIDFRAAEGIAPRVEGVRHVFRYAFDVGVQKTPVEGQPADAAQRRPVRAVIKRQWCCVKRCFIIERERRQSRRGELDPSPALVDETSGPQDRNFAVCSWLVDVFRHGEHSTEDSGCRIQDSAGIWAWGVAFAVCPGS